MSPLSVDMSTFSVLQEQAYDMCGMFCYRDTLSSPQCTVSDVLKLIVNLQKIASHPQLVKPTDVLSPFHMYGIDYLTAQLVDFMSDASKPDVCQLFTYSS